MERIFKVGDTVRVNHKDEKPTGLYGKVVHVESAPSFKVGVSFFDFTEGHSCDGKCEEGTGWWCNSKNLELVEASNYYDTHYAGEIQPIELMQMTMPQEQFIGFLIGNIIKYTMRCGKKDDPEKEKAKIHRYKYWLDLARQGVTINPRE